MPCLPQLEIVSSRGHVDPAGGAHAVIGPGVGDAGCGHSDGGGVAKAVRGVRGTEATGARLRRTRVLHEPRFFIRSVS